MHVTQKQRALAANMEAGLCIKEAMMKAGYTEVTASRGMANVSNRVVKLLAKKGIRLRELGRIDTATQEEIVRGRLVYNTIKGSDKGVLSAKALGSERRVNMFTPDSVSGVVVLSSPQNALDNKAELLRESGENPKGKASISDDRGL
jgi:hypothetical protein